jgi:hypothetical protein
MLTPYLVAEKWGAGVHAEFNKDQFPRRFHQIANILYAAGKCILTAEYLNGFRTIFLDVRRLPYKTSATPNPLGQRCGRRHNHQEKINEDA